MNLPQLRIKLYGDIHEIFFRLRHMLTYVILYIYIVYIYNRGSHSSVIWQWHCITWDQRKQAKMQWIQDPSWSNVDNLNNVRRDASRHFKNKKKAYLKAKIEELETNSKINNIRDLYRVINDFKKRYQPRTIIVKDEKGDLVADSHSIMTRWKN